MNKKAQVRRAKRTRDNMKGTDTLPRLSVHRTNTHMSAQLIDDMKAVTILGVSDKEAKGTKTEKAKQLGVALAKQAAAKKITSVIFDRGGFRYHGRVKAFAEGAREGGLKL